MNSNSNIIEVFDSDDENQQEPKQTISFQLQRTTSFGSVTSSESENDDTDIENEDLNINKLKKTSVHQFTLPYENWIQDISKFEIQLNKQSNRKNNKSNKKRNHKEISVDFVPAFENINANGIQNNVISKMDNFIILGAKEVSEKNIVNDINVNSNVNIPVIVSHQIDIESKPVKKVKNETKLALNRYQKSISEILENWIFEHWYHPYPSEEQKQELMKLTNLTYDQVCNWMTNCRRRKLQKLLRKDPDALKQKFPIPKDVLDDPTTTIRIHSNVHNYLHSQIEI